MVLYPSFLPFPSQINSRSVPCLHTALHPSRLMHPYLYPPFPSSLSVLIPSSFPFLSAHLSSASPLPLSSSSLPKSYLFPPSLSSQLISIQLLPTLSFLPAYLSPISSFPPAHLSPALSLPPFPYSLPQFYPNPLLPCLPQSSLLPPSLSFQLTLN